MFPESYFYIGSFNNGFVMDVYDGKEKEGANIILWPQKFEDSDNQLWIYKDKRLENKKSGLVIDTSSSVFKKDKTIVQKKADPTKESQEWIYDQGYLCFKEDPNLVMTVKGDTTKGGVQVILHERSTNDKGLYQKWEFKPYKKIEQALDIAKSSIPLHKKESFGKPCNGYGAEVGCPPELTSLPENSPVVCDTNPTPTIDQKSADLDGSDQYEPSYFNSTNTSQVPPPVPEHTFPPLTTTTG